MEAMWDLLYWTWGCTCMAAVLGDWGWSLWVSLTCLVVKHADKSGCGAVVRRIQSLRIVQWSKRNDGRWRGGSRIFYRNQQETTKDGKES
jgi:SRP-independent targeting protein 2/TMEM208